MVNEIDKFSAPSSSPGSRWQCRSITGLASQKPIGARDLGRAHKKGRENGFYTHRLLPKGNRAVENQAVSFEAIAFAVTVTKGVYGVGVMGKRRHPLFSALSIGCAVLVASPSWAAMIQPGLGDLTINQGQGFKPVASRTDANVGDAVMVSPGGSATIVYDDGCKVDVRPGAVTTIAPLSPCASGSNAQTYNNPNCPPGPNGLPDCGPNWLEAAI